MEGRFGADFIRSSNVQTDDWVVCKYGFILNKICQMHKFLAAPPSVASACLSRSRITSVGRIK
jgi:hypothetical protein